MRSDDSFLGLGWAFPPSFGDLGADVETVAGAEDIAQSLRILLATATGERLLRPDFGCGLPQVLFEEMDQGMVTTLRRLVEDAVLYHEPRVDLESVDVEASDTGSGLLHIRLSYTVRGTNSRYNLVYPFYLLEAAMPGE